MESLLQTNGVKPVAQFGIPLLCKQVVVTNAGTNALMLEQMVTEILAVAHDQASRLWIESD